MSSNHSRRVPVQPYAAVPTSPRTPRVQQNPQQQQQSYFAESSRGPPPPRSPSTSSHGHMPSGRAAIAQGVASGSIGSNYGPYSYHPPANQGPYSSSRFSHNPSLVSTTTAEKPLNHPSNSQTIPTYLWDARDPDLDDALHNPDPVRDAKMDRQFTIFSARGWMNAGALVVLVAGLVILFAGYPILAFYRRHQLKAVGYNLGGINGTGQIPDLPNVPQLIDKDTDQSAYTHIGSDGKKYNLVFSDEFNTPGRSFYPGDDPFWEAVDLQYWPTGDLEWYDPSAVTTEDGKLVITLSQVRNHDLNFMSAMITTWNKICFTTGYIEVSISMPGTPRAPGLWPGAWTMGNLGRAGYGATTEGMWPYSYDTCDLGTFPNQTSKAGEPAVAATGDGYGGPLSYLPGQRLSACTCPGSDHPGPSVSKGRGVPEIDIIETQVDTDTFRGQVSQSFQTAPYNYQYQFVNTTPATTIFDDTLTKFNSYKGGVYQQALSAVSYIDSQYYNGQAYAPYAFEWWSNPSNRKEGYITWFSNSVKTWTMTAASIGADATSRVSARLIPEEPMYIVLNLGMSPGFQRQDFKHLTFPTKMYIDYVRVYQRDDVKDGLTCNPKSHPTTDYIEKHIQAYSNPNLTTWAQAGNTFPRNSLYDGC